MPIAIKPFRYRLVLLLSETILSLNATLNNKTAITTKTELGCGFSPFFILYTLYRQLLLSDKRV